MFERNDRLKELFRELVTSLLREIKDPGLSGFLTVTDAELSADRKSLRVYYSVMGTEAERARTAAALLRAAPYIRGLLKKEVSVKIIPAITFCYDETPRNASRIDALLNKIEKEKGN